jgi:hypothetical protein
LNDVHPSVAESNAEHGLRRFLLIAAGLVFAGTIVELYFLDHTGEPMQFVPFVLCGLGLLAVAMTLRWTTQKTLWSLRLLTAILVAGSLLGMYEHVHANYEFERDIRPTASTRTVVGHALHGAAPIIAPGSLALAGLLAAAATYRHPVLATPATNESPVEVRRRRRMALGGRPQTR